MSAEDGDVGREDSSRGSADRRRALKRLGLTAAAAPRLSLRADLRVEELDGELVVLNPSGETVHRVTGDGVAAVRLLEHGVSEREVPPELVDAVESLVDSGLVAGRQSPSRRTVIAGGGAAAFAAATVTTFALADPAAAWSRCKNGKTPTPNDSGSTGKKYTTAGTFTWTSGPSGFHSPNTQQSYNILVRAWGGGGGGGVDGGTYGGGGGGGGAYVDATISVLECTDYTVTVGVGGSGNGGASTFKDGTTLKAAGGSKGGDGSFGNGGSGGAGGTIANSVGTNKRAGGNGGGGASYGDTACGGGSAGSTGNGGDGSAGGPGGGGSGNPGGAAGGTENNAGSAPGGGGGGGIFTAGNGAPGAVWVGV